MEKPNKETKERRFKDPKNWKWWLFYYNPEDKRLFPPKRTRLGWTTNFANRNSIIAMVVVLFVVAVILYFFIKYTS
ncbi:MAG TPA: DUF5808 domain-containing protein [Bacteroidia bacterium]|nr:DUF5808 domain-containing protein [Bacteroidia bacterium]